MRFASTFIKPEESIPIADLKLEKVDEATLVAQPWSTRPFDKE